jgi:hypothetical protein
MKSSPDYGVLAHLSSEWSRFASLRAIRDTHRVDRALPPEGPLLPVLAALVTARAAHLAFESAHVGCVA